MPRMNWAAQPEYVGRRIKEHRLRRGWTQAILSYKSGVSPRAVKTLENGGTATRKTIGKIADALAVDIVELLRERSPSQSKLGFPRFLLQKVFPVVMDPKIDRLAREGAFADMHRHYDVAPEKFKSAEKLDNALDTQAQLIVRWATSGDNAGKREEALRDLQPVLVNARFRELRPQITNWVRYHIAVAKRRSYEKYGAEREPELAEAEKTFNLLIKVGDGAQRVAAMHELGTVFWVWSMQSNLPEHRKKAEDLFTQAADEWQKIDNFREGHVLCRLADIAEFNADFERAHRLLLDALEIFTRFEAEPYRQEARARLRALFERAFACRSA